MKIPQEIRNLIESGTPAHLVTLNPDGSPQLTLVWIGFDGDDIVLYGEAHIEEGGAPELLQRLAEVYIGAGVKFLPMDNPPPGFITRVRVNRIAGVGPWTGRPV